MLKSYRLRKFQRIATVTKYMSAKEEASCSPKGNCILKPISSEDKIINLGVGKNVIGRSRETGICDTRCSKRQIELDVDVKQKRVKLKVLGLNPSGVNGLVATQDTECELQHGDFLEIVYGKLSYEVVFKSVDKLPNKNSSQIQNTSKSINKEEIDGKWESIENGKVIIFSSDGAYSSEKIAAYDMDGTIIKTKSGNVFPKHIDDWDIIYPEVPVKLKRMYQDGYKICFFTNQGGIAKGKTNLDDFKQKIKKILTRLDVPVQVFIAISDGYYRKPLPGMWEYLQKNKNENKDIVIEKCFYVGDAAGRPEAGTGVGKRKKDHSLADRLFAANINVAFYTPEEHFLGQKTAQWIKQDFVPKEAFKTLPLFEPENTKIGIGKCEVIIMVGLPGSGKSHFSHKHLLPLGYVLANADTVGSTAACLKMCENALKEGKSCVVDNTNVDAESRKKFIALANKVNVPCRCFLMNVTLTQIRHNIAFRQLTDTSHSKINDMVFNMMKKKFKTPTLDEGLTDIVKVNLKPEFSDAENERIYKLFLLEK